MLDFRINTFLTVCRVMSYTRTAELLCMTQPAVSQQIRYLEESYGVKLFEYKGRALTKTAAGEKLEQYALSMQQNENNIRRLLQTQQGPFCLRVGATKTIGDYVVGDHISKYLRSENRTVELRVDNTRVLLNALEQGDLDLALIEGMFDKEKYTYKLLKKVPFVGVCACNHRFAGESIPLEEIFSENIIVREVGSGTRDIFENVLHDRGFTLQSFKKVITISNFSVIKHLVRNDLGISFLYETVLSRNSDELAFFTIKERPLDHEFNYVWLKNQAFCDEVVTFME